MSRNVPHCAVFALLCAMVAGNTIEQTPDFARQTNTFGFKLMEKVRTSVNDDNVVISPTSIGVALSMLMNGADNQTRQQIATLLGITQSDLSKYNTAVGEFLDSAVSSDSELEIELANAIFTAKTKKIDPAFLKTVQREFQARAKELDFAGDPAAAVAKINDWVSDKTHGKIPKLFDSLAADTEMVVTNALYFNAKWSQPFEVTSTTNRTFTTKSNAKVQVPTMNLCERLPYIDRAEYQAVSLAYGDDRRFVMDVYLPKQGVTLDKVMAVLNESALSKKNAEDFSQNSTLVQLYLPRFKVSFARKLNADLISLGMMDAFNDKKADFGKLFTGGGRYAVDLVQHNTFIDVTEVGTEAAAATGISITAITSVDTTQPVLVNVNKPFLFTIRDTTSGAILFMGSREVIRNHA